MKILSVSNFHNKVVWYSKKRFCDEIKWDGKFSTSNIWFSDYWVIFLLLIVSAAISSNTINILRFFLDCTHKYFCRYYLWALGHLKWFKTTSPNLLMRYWYFALYGSLACKCILSISGWYFIKLSTLSVFMIQSH